MQPGCSAVERLLLRVEDDFNTQFLWLGKAYFLHSDSVKHK